MLLFFFYFERMINLIPIICGVRGEGGGRGGDLHPLLFPLSCARARLEGKKTTSFWRQKLPPAFIFAPKYLAVKTSSHFRANFFIEADLSRHKRGEVPSCPPFPPLPLYEGGSELLVLQIEDAHTKRLGGERALRTLCLTPH